MPDRILSCLGHVRHQSVSDITYMLLRGSHHDVKRHRPSSLIFQAITVAAIQLHVGSDRVTVPGKGSFAVSDCSLQRLIHLHTTLRHTQQQWCLHKQTDTPTIGYRLNVLLLLLTSRACVPCTKRLCCRVCSQSGTSDALPEQLHYLVSCKSNRQMTS